MAQMISREGPKGKVMRLLRRLRTVQFFCKHRLSDTEGTTKKIYSIQGYEDRDARATTFEMKRRKADGTETTETISVAAYYLKTYNIRLKYPGLPLVRTRKRGEFFPMELCFVQEAQRYPFKLNERQTADMIKFCVQRPAERINMIKNNVEKLSWSKDPVLRDYGLQIDTQGFKTQARILPVPQIVYGPGSSDQKISPVGGRWDLRGKKFSSWGPIAPIANGGLKAWGVIVFGSPGRMPEAVIKNYFREQIKSIIGHGGHVVSKVCFSPLSFSFFFSFFFSLPPLLTIYPQDPPIMYADASKAPGANVFELYKKAGNKANMKPQILFVILAAKSPQPYNDIKAYCDIQLGVPSQCKISPAPGVRG